MIIKNLDNLSELRELIEAYALAFESEYKVSDDYLQSLLNNKQAIIIGAVNENKVAGGVVAFEIWPIHGAKEVYVYDIAVHPTHQKQGIGRQLMQELKAQALARGAKTVFVEAEADDDGAVAFYRAIGGEELEVRHFNFSL